MKILFVAAAIPAPDRKGYQVRLYHQMIRLAERHRLTLCALDPDGISVPDLVRDACQEIVVVPISRREKLIGAARYVAKLPLTVGYLQTPAMQAAVSRLATAGDYDLVHFQMIRMAPYARRVGRRATLVDLVDALSVNMVERAQTASVAIRPAVQLEARRLRRYERHVVPTFDRATIISGRDQAAIGSDNLVVLANGVEIPQAPTDARRSGIVFSGNMSYFANEDAATWFIEQVLPLIRQQEPTAALTIVGRNPSEGLRAIAARHGATVTGEVPSTTAYLLNAAVAICPMRVGSGIPTKILEAMAAGAPVIATSKAAGGLPDDLIGLVETADSAAQFAAAAIRMLRNPHDARQIAETALDRVRREHSWERSVAHLEEIYQEVVTADPTSVG